MIASGLVGVRGRPALPGCRYPAGVAGVRGCPSPPSCHPRPSLLALAQTDLTVRLTLSRIVVVPAAISSWSH